MITLLLLIVVLGVCAYLVEAYVPMSQPFKVVFRLVVVLIIVIYTLNLLGLAPDLNLR